MPPASPAENPRATIGGNNPPILLEVQTADQLKAKHAKLWERLKSWKAKMARANMQPVTLEDCKKLDDLYGEGRDLANDAETIRKREKDPFFRAGEDIDALFNIEIRDVTMGPNAKTPGPAKKALDASAARKVAISREEQARAAAAAAAAQAEADRLAAQAKRQEEAGKVQQADVTNAKVDALDNQAAQLQGVANAEISDLTKGVTTSGRTASATTKLDCVSVDRDNLDLEKLRPYLKPAVLVDAVNAALKMEAFTSLKGANIVEKAVGRVR